MKKHRKERLVKKLPKYNDKNRTLYQGLPGIFEDRIRNLCILSFLILLFGIFMGVEMKSLGFMFWSVFLCGLGIRKAVCVLHTARLGNYEVVEGIVCEVAGKNPLWKLRKVKVVFLEGGETILLLEKNIAIEQGVQYRFYFRDQPDVLSGVRRIDAALSTDSFLGLEKADQG